MTKPAAGPMFRGVTRSRAGEVEGRRGGAGGLKRRRQRPVRDVQINDERDRAGWRGDQAGAPRRGARLRQNAAAISSSASSRAAAGPSERRRRTAGGCRPAAGGSPPSGATPPAIRAPHGPSC